MLTRGEKGVLWASEAGLQVISALPVQVVDTVGAGDAFNAGLAVGLSEGMGTLESIALGVTAASLSTQRRETIASYSRRAEVDHSRLVYCSSCLPESFRVRSFCR